MITTDWYGCYKTGWGKNLTPAAFSHPAKISYLLAQKIYEHAFEQGWLEPGSQILDPFGGIAGTAFHALQRGLHWTGIELEPKFVDLGQGYACPGFGKAFWKRYHLRGQRLNYKLFHLCQDCEKKLISPPETRRLPWAFPHHFEGNLSLWNTRYAAHFPGWGSARLLRGDSRKLAQILHGHAQAAVSSPPYINSLDSEKNGIEWEKVKKDYPGRVIHAERVAMQERHHNARKYGEAEGQLGRMPNMGFDLAVSSPPFQKQNEGGGLSKLMRGEETNYRDSTGRQRENEKSKPGYMGQGITEGQLANLPPGDFALAVSSPPYSSSDQVHSRPSARDAEIFKGRTVGTHGSAEYGQSDGQLANLPEGDFTLAVSSPPYRGGGHHNGIFDTWGGEIGKTDTPAWARLAKPGEDNGYGQAAGQMEQMPEGDFAAAINSDRKRDDVAPPITNFDLVLSSPPYAQARIDGNGDEGSSGLRNEDGSYVRGSEGWEKRQAMGGRYGDSAGNLANLPPEGFDLAISSPPYAETPVNKTHMTTKARVDPAHPHYRPSWKKKFEEGYDKTEQPYGETDGQLGTLPVGDFDLALSSPPYIDSVNSETSGGIDWEKAKRPDRLVPSPNRHNPMTDGKMKYGGTEGQLGAMGAGEFAASVSSPPFEGVTPTRGDPDYAWKFHGHQAEYGFAEGQMGNQSGNDFWTAARQILDQLYTVLAPGGHAIWVVKNFVRNKEIVNFCEQWRILCEAAGFTIVCQHRAWLVETKAGQSPLFGGDTSASTTNLLGEASAQEGLVLDMAQDHVINGNKLGKTEVHRKSFFRRLHEKKYPELAINYEMVICTRKPLDTPVAPAEALPARYEQGWLD